MAVIAPCPKHGNVGHSSSGECCVCRAEEELKDLEQWEAIFKTADEKFRDLYHRIKALERGPARY